MVIIHPKIFEVQKLESSIYKYFILRKRESRRLSGDGLVLGAERLGNDEDCRKWNN
jgi:hypothetical protein